MSKIAVKRDGPRGWHWIARENYDPAVHVRHVLDPLDGDSDGRKGGSMPDAFVVDGSGTIETETAPVRKGGSRKRKAA